MNKYEFMLTFRLPQANADPEAYQDVLFEAGCDDAAVGTGKRGMIGLHFVRRAASAEEALQSAIANVERAIPGVQLIEAGPDLVNLTDVADIVGCSRQNMRKYAAGEMRTIHEGFPHPVFIGSPSLWQLAEIASWLARHAGVQPPAEMIELSRATARANFEVQRKRLNRILETA